jgi:corrinoid protein of di/trimethylamine methyltransferase
MAQGDVLCAISAAVQQGDDDACVAGARQALAQGVSPLTIINEGLTAGIRIVGEKFGSGEMFLPELMMAMKTMKEGIKVVEPELKKAKLEQKSLGKVVIGTVKGDIHDIGKNIVASLMELAGLSVVDLGINVPAETFVKRAVEEKADVVGLSAMLTTTMQEQRTVVKALEAAGVRGKVKVVIGGAPVSEEWAREIGADGRGANAELAVQLVRRLMGAAEAALRGPAQAGPKGAAEAGPEGRTQAV